MCLPVQGCSTYSGEKKGSIDQTSFTNSGHWLWEATGVFPSQCLAPLTSTAPLAYHITVVSPLKLRSVYFLCCFNLSGRQIKALLVFGWLCPGSMWGQSKNCVHLFVGSQYCFVGCCYDPFLKEPLFCNCDWLIHHHPWQRWVCNSWLLYACLCLLYGDGHHCSPPLVLP